MDSDSNEYFEMFGINVSNSGTIQEASPNLDCSFQTTEDPHLRNLLESWKLPHLYTMFRDQSITMERLSYLQKHHIEKLFYNIPVGDQAHFEFFFGKWKKGLSKQPQIIDDDAAENPTCSKKNLLSTILNSSSHGSTLKKSYKATGKFNEQQRLLLINVIANYINSHGISYTLADCTDIEKQITLMFPSEQFEYYSNGKRGRLYNKLANIRRVFKEAAATENVPPKPDNIRSEENADEVIKVMRSDHITAENFDNLWKQCVRFRENKIKESKSSAEIIQDWPEFKRPYGYRFVNIDFEIRFPNAESMLAVWDIKSAKIEKYLRTKVTNASVSKTLNNINNLKKDSRDLFLLWALHFAFPPLPTMVEKSSGKKSRTKFSIAESQECFAIIGKSMLEIETTLKLKKLKGLPIQPCLLIIGEVTDIKEIFVYFDEVRYALLSTVAATDICFKLFYIFNLKYPEASIMFYKFIESFFYNLGSKKSSKIATTIHDINMF